jgi:hypothetical protein
LDDPEGYLALTPLPALEAAHGDRPAPQARREEETSVDDTVKLMEGRIHGLIPDKHFAG